MDGGKLLFQWPLLDGLATLGDGDFTAALEAQLEDIRELRERQHAGPAPPQQPSPKEVPSQPDREVKINS